MRLLLLSLLSLVIAQEGDDVPQEEVTNVGVLFHDIAQPRVASDTLFALHDPIVDELADTALLTKRVSEKRADVTGTSFPMPHVPVSVDYSGHARAVRNQGRCGSCVGWSYVHAVEMTTNALRETLDLPPVVVDGMDMLSCYDSDLWGDSTSSFSVTWTIRHKDLPRKLSEPWKEEEDVIRHFVAFASTSGVELLEADIVAASIPGRWTGWGVSYELSINVVAPRVRDGLPPLDKAATVTALQTLARPYYTDTEDLSLLGKTYGMYNFVVRSGRGRTVCDGNTIRSAALWQYRQQRESMLTQGQQGSLPLAVAESSAPNHLAMLQGKEIGPIDADKCAAVDRPSRRPGLDAQVAVTVSAGVGFYGRSSRAFSGPVYRAIDIDMADDGDESQRAEGYANVIHALLRYGPLHCGIFSACEEFSKIGTSVGTATCVSGRHAIVVAGVDFDPSRPFGDNYFLIYNSWGPDFGASGVAKVSFASTILFECNAPMLGLYNGAAEAEAEAANVFPIAGAARFFSSASLFAGQAGGAFQDQYRDMLTNLAAATGAVQLTNMPEVPVQSPAQLYDLSVYSEVEPDAGIPRIRDVGNNAALRHKKDPSFPSGYWAMVSSIVPGARIRTYLVEDATDVDEPKHGGHKLHPQHSNWWLVPGMPRVLLNSVSVTLAHFGGDEAVLGGVTVEVILWPSTEAPAGSARPRAVRLPAVGCTSDRSTTKSFVRGGDGGAGTMALCSFDLPVPAGGGGSRDASEELGSVSTWQSRILPADEIGHVEVRVSGLSSGVEVALYGVVVSYDSVTSTLFGAESSYPAFADPESKLLPSFDTAFDTSLVGARAAAVGDDEAGISPAIIASIVGAVAVFCCCAVALVAAVVYSASRRRRSTVSTLRPAHPNDHHHNARSSRGSRRTSHKFVQRA
jgi:hypothetical protein